MIIWHGWSDAAVNALNTIRYYEDAETNEANAQEAKRTSEISPVSSCCPVSAIAVGARAPVRASPVLLIVCRSSRIG